MDLNLSFGINNVNNNTGKYPGLHIPINNPNTIIAIIALSFIFSSLSILLIKNDIVKNLKTKLSDQKIKISFGNKIGLGYDGCGTHTHK